LFVLRGVLLPYLGQPFYKRFFVDAFLNEIVYTLHTRWTICSRSLGKP